MQEAGGAYRAMLDLVFADHVDQEFPLMDVARAIKDVVRGNEDLDRERFLRGAEYLAEMDRRYREGPLRLEVLETRVRPRPCGKGNVDVIEVKASDGADMPDLLSRLPSGTRHSASVDQERRSPHLEATAVVKADAARGPVGVVRRWMTSCIPSWTFSSSLLRTFVEYWDEDQIFIQVGVCHSRMCEKLYVKNKYSPGVQKYCSKKCRQEEYLARRREETA